MTKQQKTEQDKYNYDKVRQDKAIMSLQEIEFLEYDNKGSLQKLLSGFCPLRG